MAKKPSKRAKKEQFVDGVLGIGLDSTDGHHRITRTEEMVLVGGSPETHEQMQDTAIRFSEALEKRGKTLRETSVQEAIELLHEARERSR